MQTATWQSSLFATAAAVGTDPAFPGLVRHALAHEAWLDHLPGWLAGADTLVEPLIAQLPWRQGTERIQGEQILRPRLTAGLPVERFGAAGAGTGAAGGVGEAGAVAGVGVTALPPDGGDGFLGELVDPTASRDRPFGPELEVFGRIGAQLSARYDVRFARVGVNLYRDGRDSVAWHGDRIARDLPTATIAIVSLGQPRMFRARPVGGGASLGFRLGHGDLLVMGGTFQRTWQHAVPKVAAAGVRISVTYRHAYPAPARRSS
jgi:hypothetical protein